MWHVPLRRLCLLRYWLWRLKMNFSKRERRNVIEEVNKQNCDKVISLNVNSTLMQGSLYKAAGKLCAKLSKAKGGAERKKIKSGKTRIILQTEDTVDVGAVQDELQQTKVALADVTELTALENEAVEVFLEEEEREREVLKQALNVRENRGKAFHEVGERQKRRKVSQIKTYTASTLEPCLSSYGLAPTSLTATTVDGGIVTIPSADSPPHNSSTELHTAKDATVSTLYLLDRFAVSD